MSTDCPPPHRLKAWLDNEAAAGDTGPLAAHVASCPACQATLDRLTDDSELRGWAAAPAPDGTIAYSVLRRLERPPSPAAAPPPPEVGPFRLGAVIGRGGMGLVCRGR